MCVVAMCVDVWVCVRVYVHSCVCVTELMGDVEGLMNDRPLILRAATRKVFSVASPSKAARKRMAKKKTLLRRAARSSPSQGKAASEPHGCAMLFLLLLL